MVDAFRFELTKVQTPAVRSRVVALLANIDPILATGVADGLGIEVPPPLPLATDLPVPVYEPVPSLSLLHRPGTTGIHTKKVAILVAAGTDAADVHRVYRSLLDDGAVPRLVSSQLGKIAAQDGGTLDVEISLEAGPSVLYDAVVVPDGDAAAATLARNAHALDFLRLQYRHCKPILVVGGGVALLARAGIPATLPDGSLDEALIGARDEDLAQALQAFKKVLAAPRSFARESDPPAV